MSSSIITYTNPPKRKVMLKRNTSKSLLEPTPLNLNSHMTSKTLKKTVRFKDDNMEHVRYFYKSQTPLTVKNDPPVMELSSHDFKLSLPHWPIRNPLQQGDTKIRMETVILSEGDTDQMKKNELNLEGRCRVNNISFEKMVTVRYSIDLWNTSNETTAIFRESIPSTNHQWDRFTFSIPIQAKNETQVIYLALKYSVNNMEYWDNNNGKNYEIVMTPLAPLENDSDINKEEPVHSDTSGNDDSMSEQLVLIKTKDATKVLGRRYDFGASLSAARKPLSPPPSPPVSPIDLQKDKVDQYHHSHTPSLFYHKNTERTFGVRNNTGNGSYGNNNSGHSYNSSSYSNGNNTSHIYQHHETNHIEQPPSPTINNYSQYQYYEHKSTASVSEPIPIQSPVPHPISADGYQMSYSDFINKYCFYNPSHISNYSSSPSAVLS
ncbi:putative phosphatase regulatory subunit-domain-containing protein [Pilobolus umbonatus]|nr:putative phosphatase regulatory subunit-domain-containing protein [Pilobolus umbonatus]